MGLLTWKDSYSLGVDEIDEQHMKIFEIINKLYDSMKNNAGIDQLKAILKEFSDYALYHFETEEDLFEKYDYGDKIPHTAAHNIYREKIKDFDNKLGKKEDFLSFNVLDFMEDWWFGHVTNVDCMFKKFFESKGVK